MRCHVTRSGMLVSLSPALECRATSQGENLAWGYAGFEAAIDAWYAEESQYNYGRGGFSSATGHFTQLVWRDTTRLGCAYNFSCGMKTYVCNYSPPGNVMGAGWSQQVPPPRS